MEITGIKWIRSVSHTCRCVGYRLYQPVGRAEGVECRQSLLETEQKRHARTRAEPSAGIPVGTKVKKKRLSASNLTESLWNRIGLPIPEFVIIEKRQCSADDEACAGVRQSFHDKCKDAGCRAVVDNGTSGKDKDDACDTCSEDEVVVNPEK